MPTHVHSQVCEWKHEEFLSDINNVLRWSRTEDEGIRNFK